MRDEPAKTVRRAVLFPGSPAALKSAGRRLVYSSGRGRICAKCGWPEVDCHCSSRLGAPAEPVPEKVTAKLSLEKRGSGKVVTVIAGLPDNRTFLETLARELKRSCGTGGRVGAAEVEIQGDHRERLRDLFGRKGWIVKG